MQKLFDVMWHFSKIIQNLNFDNVAKCYAQNCPGQCGISPKLCKIGISIMSQYINIWIVNVAKNGGLNRQCFEMLCKKLRNIFLTFL